MLPKSQRLNLKKNYKFVSAGKRFESNSFRLMFRDGELETPLVGIALAKKTFNKAHDRNRARRLASTAIQSLYPSLRKKLNLVIMPKSQILERDVEEITKELKSVKALYSAD